MPSKETAIKHSAILAVYLLLVWGFYRILFKLPDELEELVIKPLLWLGPVLFLVHKEKLGLASLGITSKNLVPSVYLALFLGVIFAIEGVIVNFIKYQAIEFAANIGSTSLFLALAISLATAVSEEVTFRGFIFNRVWSALENEWKANFLVSIVWALIHVPIVIFWWELDLSSALGILLLTTLFGIGSSFVFARTRNVASSILLHLLWEWPIILFR